MQRIARALCLAALGLAGCETEGASESPATAPEPTPGSAAPEKAGSPSEAAGPRVDDPTFTLALARSGEALTLSLEGKGGYHVNQDFPFNADFSGSSAGVTLGKKSLSKDDAKVFSEEGASFEVPLEVAEADQQVKAKVRFAVCTEETCVPDTRTLVLAVNP